VKVLIENGKICIPKEIIKKVNLPENGECEVEVSNSELKIFSPQNFSLKLEEMLYRKPLIGSIEEMIEEEVIEDV